jgi:predicted metal-binding protein
MRRIDPIAVTRTRCQDIVLVCGKCTRKLHGGFGKKAKKNLADELRSELRDAGRKREVRVVETGCLSLCPKHAVTILCSRRPGELLAISAGSDVQDVCDLIPPQM